MSREFTRADRVADAIQRELAIMIRESVRDPRVGMTSITDIEVSRDLAYCKAYVSFVGERNDDKIESAMSALNGASGYLRSLLATRIKLRTTPKISFTYDDTGVKGQRISTLIDRAVSSNAPRSEQDA